MTESPYEHGQNRTGQGARCADPNDLAGYLLRVSTDAQSLRHGLADAVTKVFAGILLPDELGGTCRICPTAWNGCCSTT